MKILFQVVRHLADLAEGVTAVTVKTEVVVVVVVVAAVATAMVAIVVVIVVISLRAYQWLDDYVPAHDILKLQVDLASECPPSHD